METLVKFHPIERDDLELLRDWRNSDQVRLRCREYRLLNMDDQEHWFNSMLGDSDFLMFKIEAVQIINGKRPGELQGSGSIFIGVCGWTHIDWRSRHALLSMYIGDPIHDKPEYYAAILRELIRVGFQDIGMHCLRAEIYDFDPCREHILKAGFQENGKRRQQYYRNGKFCDILLTDLTVTEWLKTHA